MFTATTRLRLYQRANITHSNSIPRKQHCFRLHRQPPAVDLCIRCWQLYNIGVILGKVRNDYDICRSAQYCFWLSRRSYFLRLYPSRFWSQFRLHRCRLNSFTHLCDVEPRGLTTAQQDALLAAMWTNRDATKTRSQRVINLKMVQPSPQQSNRRKSIARLQ